MTIFLQNNGQPHLPPNQRRPFPLPAARAFIAVGERLAITADVLAAHGYDTTEESAKNFATFVAGIYNGNRTPEWLSVIESKAEPKTRDKSKDTTTPITATGDAQSAAPDTAGDPGQGETA